MSIATLYENYSPMWFTPPEWLEWVTATFETSDWFDPCPSDWDDSKRNGLEGPWMQRCYCNHPGSRGSTSLWWGKAMAEHTKGTALIWCAFNCEQLRHMKPSPFMQRGWLVMPEERIGFIWGGPDLTLTDGKMVPAQPGDEVHRAHGEIAKSPGNWTVFWSSAEPAPTPKPCVIVPTGTEGDVEEARDWAKSWRRRATAAEKWISKNA